MKSKTSNTTANSQPGAVKSEETIKKEMHDKFQAKLDEITGLSDNDETLIKTINLHINEFGFGYYEWWGFSDGKIGTRDYHIMKTAKAHATRISDHVKSKLAGRIAALVYAINEKMLRLDLLKVSVEKAQKNLDQINEDENDDDKQFNGRQAWLYIVFGILMIVSDIVVSINLVEFFGIGNTHGVDGQAESFFGKLADMELLMFSLGIAFCTVYIKILYDDYINTKLGYFQKEKIKVVRNYPEIKKSGLVIGHALKMIVKLILLVGLFVFLFYLAKYRTYFTMQNVEIVADAVTNESNIGEIIRNCFIGISLMVPIISGISLSVGFRIWGRKKMMEKLKENKKDIQKEYENFYQDLFKLNSKKDELSTFHTEWNAGPDNIHNITEMFANNYNQGFRKGYRSNHGNDLYVLVEEFRNEVVNVSLSKKISNEVT